LRNLSSISILGI